MLLIKQKNVWIIHTIIYKAVLSYERLIQGSWKNSTAIITIRSNLFLKLKMAVFGFLLNEHLLGAGALLGSSCGSFQGVLTCELGTERVKIQNHQGSWGWVASPRRSYCPLSIIVSNTDTTRTQYMNTKSAVLDYLPNFLQPWTLSNWCSLWQCLNLIIGKMFLFQMNSVFSLKYVILKHWG